MKYMGMLVVSLKGVNVRCLVPLQVVWGKNNVTHEGLIQGYTKTASNCLHKLIQINRIKHLLDKKTLTLLMNCFIFSKLFYCLTVWLNTSRFNIKILQLVQNFAAGIVLGLRKFDHISHGIRSLNWLPVCDRLYLNDAVMIFNVLIILSLIIWQKKLHFALKLILEIQDRATI